MDAFIDSHLKKAEPLPALGKLTRTGNKVSASLTIKGKPKSAQLLYAEAVGPWQKREWKSAPAETGHGQVTATLPAERPLVYFLSVTDQRGLQVSTAHAVDSR